MSNADMTSDGKHPISLGGGLNIAAYQHPPIAAASQTFTFALQLQFRFEPIVNWQAELIFQNKINLQQLSYCYPLSSNLVGMSPTERNLWHTETVKVQPPADLAAGQYRLFWNLFTVTKNGTRIYWSDMFRQQNNFINWIKAGEITLREDIPEFQKSEISTFSTAELSLRLRQYDESCAISSNQELTQRVINQGENDYATNLIQKRQYSLPIALILNEAKKRDLKTAFHPQSHLEVKLKSRSLLFRLNTCDNTVVAKSITPRKHLTKQILSENKIPVPQGGIFKDYQTALSFFEKLNSSVAIKPELGSHGHHVFTGIKDKNSFDKAWQLANNNNKNEVIVEQHINGDDLRVIVIGGKAVSAYVRVPANVTGNGRDNVRDLIEQKRQRRKNNPRIRRVQFNRLEQLYKNGKDLDYIPADNEAVQLASIANISAGGDIVEINEYLHPSILQLAENAVQSIPGLNVAGVDMLVESFIRDAREQSAYIIEINSDPAIADAVFPVYGHANDIPAVLFDHAISQQNNHNSAHFPIQMIAAEYRDSQAHNITKSKQELQIELIKQAAYSKNLEVKEYSALLYQISDAKQNITFYRAMSENTPAVSRKAANDLTWTRKLLVNEGIKIPETRTFAQEEKTAAWKYVENLNGKVSIKPRIRSGTRGISIGIANKEEFALAWKRASATNSSRIIVEQHIDTNNYSILVIANSVIAVSQRIPAYIIGDGKHSIQKLLESKNQKRQDNPYTATKLIKLNRLDKQKLSTQGYRMNTVLAVNERLKLLDDPNTNRGAENIDVGDAIHPDFVQIALSAQKALFNPFQCMLNLVAEDIKKAPAEQSWAVIELNTNIDLALYHFPVRGSARDAAGQMLNLIFNAKNHREG